MLDLTAYQLVRFRFSAIDRLRGSESVLGLLRALEEIPAEEVVEVGWLVACGKGVRDGHPEQVRSQNL